MQPGMVVCLLSKCFLRMLCVLYSSKLADVLRKLHNANDMLHSSAYEASQPDSPHIEETSVTQSTVADSFAASNDCQLENVEQSSDVQRECQDTVVDHEPTAQECPVTKVQSN